MYLVKEITSDAKQKHTLVLFNGESLVLTLEYKPMQQSWFADWEYDGFSVRGTRISSHPNLLRQFRNLIPFGLACYTDKNAEPLLQEDFSSGRSKLYILDDDEVESVEEFISG